MADANPNTDVVELCALLQCLGFCVKSLDCSDGNMSQESGAGARTVIINCQASGLHVVLESPSVSCSCPAPTSQQNSGVWQVSGVTGGKQLDKEFGCTLLSSLPKPHRDRLSTELLEMIRCIRHQGEDDVERRKEDKSASMTELKTPEKMLQKIQIDTPTRYRSLDTLTGKPDKECEELPAPRALQRPRPISDFDHVVDKAKQKNTLDRQGTYTMESTPDNIRRKNKTSSPIRIPQNTLLDTLIAAQKAAEEVQSRLSTAIGKLMEEGRDDSSISSLALDVSKISVLKVSENPRAQFSSSPNLSGIAGIEDSTKSRLKRYESVSTSNLNHKSGSKEKSSRLRRISPNFFKKETPVAKDKVKSQDGKGKLQSLFKTKIATPVRPLGSPALESSPSFSNSSRNKYSHIKSTIPRPAKKD